MAMANFEPALTPGPQAGERPSMLQAAVLSPWQQVRGRTREWCGRLTDGDLDQVRQFDRFIGQIQERHGFSRERAAKEVVRRMAKHRASPEIRD